MKTPRSPLRRFAGLAVAAASLTTAMPAAADFVSLGGGSYAGLPLYRALVFGGIDTLAASSPGFLTQDMLDGVDYVSNTASIGSYSGGGTVSANGATLSGNAWTADSGFMASRNHAAISVSNAQATDTYYMVAGQGGTRQVHLEANAPVASATFTWNITGGATTSGLGTANARLDFGMTTSPATDWTDFLFGAGETAMTSFGPGVYSYVAPLSGMAMDLYLYYWSSAFASLSYGSFTNGSNAALTANFGSTYVLDSVQLFDAFGSQITQWSMTDSASGQTLFDQSGRIAAVAGSPFGDNAVPEPASAALLLAALAVLGWTRRSRSEACAYAVASAAS